jgi:hypothetical protein
MSDTHPLTENEQLAEGVLRLVKTVRYLVGIAERGEGRPMLDDETAEAFVLRYVQRLEKALDDKRRELAELRGEMKNLLVALTNPFSDEEKIERALHLVRRALKGKPQ